MGVHRHRVGVNVALALCAWAVVCHFLNPTRAFAVEVWADSRLPATEGLQLWLDAGTAAGKEPAAGDGKLSVWNDASGHGRHVRQDEESARPTLLKAGSAAIVRFDGVDDHFRAVEQGEELKAFTAILVAAPRHNIGSFRGLMALNALNERDYKSGLTVDLGATGNARFSSLNVEGRGFGGAKNLRTGETPFGRLHTLVITSDAEAKTVRLMVDGQAEGERPRDGSPVSLDEITVGARYFNNGSGPQRVEGYIRADVAEILLYDRSLAENELQSVQKYLDDKYAELRDALPPDDDGASELLAPVENPPPVQMFMPGFTARQLPVELSNINNVKYRADGVLVALAYDGTIWLLRDTDGDGLEDKADQFWGNESQLRSTIGMDLTPVGYKHGNGVCVVSKARCVLILDTDGDDRADKEIEVAGGWKENFVQVDGVGVAFHPEDGSIYFGRGTFNFTDPLLFDKEGKPKYKLTDESGVVIRAAPDFKSRKVVATGIRFPIGMRFNRDGDLFVTDQEGATWVPNGNPFDELLHVQPGRHYGFPSRHPTHLPNVIDEPSTFDYAPQHQSACGLNFNEPVKPGGPVFGPPAWAGDVFVAGYSRGKLYRTKLAKTAQGYIAQTQLLACLNMLTVDACVGPAGELVVACHSGGPDWGSGPTGKGKLFKIEYADRDHPQPALVWASSPQELRVEFDRPVNPLTLRNVLSKSQLTAGPFVGAGDRFESLWPGYAVVQAQKISPRTNVALQSAQLTEDGRTLVLATDRMPKAVRYALTLPGMGRQSEEDISTGTLPQHDAVDLEFDLSGCEATWQPADGAEAWKGWLPHLDLDVSRKMTAGSTAHDALWATMGRPGQLTLRCQLNLADMLRPAVQPGSKIDYQYPPEAVTVMFKALPGTKVELISPRDKADQSIDSHDDASASFEVPPDVDKLIPIELRLTSAESTPSLAASWTTNEDARPRPFPLRRLLLPWADVSDAASEAVPAPPAELAGGSWARGYRTFFGEKAACSKCHTMHGQGARIGPDLSNLVHRDYASVLRDIMHPSFAINPDYLTYTVILADGRVTSGVVHTTEDTISVGGANGETLELEKSEIDEMHPSSVSTMPEDLAKQVDADQLRDLMTFLLTPPPQMPRDLAGPRPKARSVAEVNAALAGAPKSPAKLRPLEFVLVAGPKDHGTGEHDYPAWQKVWSELMAAAADVNVSTAWEWPDEKAFETADVIVFYQRGDWTPSRARDIDAYLERGGGLVYIHWAIDGREHGREFSKRIGLASGGLNAFRHGEMTLAFNRETNHPIIRNFDKLTLIDETYWKLQGKLPDGRSLATAVEDGQPEPQLWTTEPRNGRVFVSIPGHYSWTFDDPLFRVLLLRGIAWAAGEPVDRFNELVWPGAEIAR